MSLGRGNPGDHQCTGVPLTPAAERGPEGVLGSNKNRRFMRHLLSLHHPAIKNSLRAEFPNLLSGTYFSDVLAEHFFVYTNKQTNKHNQPTNQSTNQKKTQPKTVSGFQQDFK